MDNLTGLDYMNRPYLELVSHPDFSILAWGMIESLKKMNTEELENITIIGGLLGRGQIDS